MEVKSKYKEGEIIFFMQGDIPTKGRITGITYFTGTRVSVDGSRTIAPPNGPLITYHVDEFKDVMEERAYKTKEDLIEGSFAAL